MYECIMKRYMVSGAEVDTEGANIYTLCSSAKPSEQLESQYTSVCQWDWSSLHSKVRHFDLFKLLLELMTTADYVTALQKPSAKLSSDANHRRYTRCMVHPYGAKGAPTDVIFKTEGDDTHVVFRLIGDVVDNQSAITILPVHMATKVNLTLDKKERAFVADMFGIALLFYMSGRRTLKQVQRWLRQQHKICKRVIGGTVLQVNRLCRALGNDSQMEALLNRLTFWDESVRGDGFSVYTLKGIEDEMNNDELNG